MVGAFLRSTPALDDIFDHIERRIDQTDDKGNEHHEENFLQPVQPQRLTDKGEGQRAVDKIDRNDVRQVFHHMSVEQHIVPLVFGFVNQEMQKGNNPVFHGIVENHGNKEKDSNHKNAVEETRPPSR